jgi:hypothetical protein
LAEGKDYELLQLLRGEADSPWVSEPERRLLKFAVNTFGERLAQVLLTGLGEETTEQRWSMSVTYSGGGEVTHTGRLHFITYEPVDGSSFLSRGRDPLVLISLLRLLPHQGQEFKADLTYDLNDLMNLLGWEDTEGDRHEIDQAVERYSYLMYVWEASGAALADRNLSSHKARERLISKYHTTDEEMEGSGEVRRIFNRVVFNVAFIDNLRRRSLFDINWNSVLNVRLTGR